MNIGKVCEPFQNACNRVAKNPSSGCEFLRLGNKAYQIYPVQEGMVDVYTKYHGDLKEGYKIKESARIYQTEESGLIPFIKRILKLNQPANPIEGTNLAVWSGKKEVFTPNGKGTFELDGTTIVDLGDFRAIKKPDGSCTVGFTGFQYRKDDYLGSVTIDEETFNKIYDKLYAETKNRKYIGIFESILRKN